MSEIHSLFDICWNMAPAFTCDSSSNTLRTLTAGLRTSHVQYGIKRKTVNFGGGCPTFAPGWSSAKFLPAGVLNRGKGKIFKGNVAHFQGKPEKPVSFLYLFILEGNIK